ncbi:MAG: hypothetical protein RLN62_01850 [Rickettsiales bacterium]
MKKLTLILLVFIVTSCSSFKDRRYKRDKRAPTKNATISETINQESMDHVDREINNFRFKDDFSRTPISHINFDDMPSKVIIDDVDVKHENIYELPKSKITTKYKSPSKKRYKKRKPKIVRSNYKAKQKSFPDLRETPTNQNDPKQNQKYSQKKSGQVTEMQRRSSQVRMPSKKPHEVAPSNTNRQVDPATQQNQVNAKLQQLQSQHQTVVQNSKQVAGQQPANTQQKPVVNLRVVPPANQQQPAANTPNLRGGSVPVPSPAGAANQNHMRSNAGMVPVPSPTAAANQNYMQPNTAAVPVPSPGAAQQQANHPNNMNAPAIPSVPSTNNQGVMTGQNPAVYSNQQQQQNVHNQQQHTAPNAGAQGSGIPPAPKPPEGFFDKVEDAVSHMLHPSSPADSTKGKKKISIQKDLSLKTKDQPKESSLQGGSWDNPQPNYVVGNTPQKQQQNSSKNKINSALSHSLGSDQKNQQQKK